MMTVTQSSNSSFLEDAISLSLIGVEGNESHAVHCGFLVIMSNLKHMNFFDVHVYVFKVQKELYGIANKNLSLFISTDMRHDE